jgi:hypothetical protein
MSNKNPFHIQIAETRHFGFEVWARSENEAVKMAQKIWREAATTGQWEIGDQEVEYEATALTIG